MYCVYCCVVLSLSLPSNPSQLLPPSAVVCCDISPLQLSMNMFPSSTMIPEASVSSDPHPSLLHTPIDAGALLLCCCSDEISFLGGLICTVNCFDVWIATPFTQFAALNITSPSLTSADNEVHNIFFPLSNPLTKTPVCCICCCM